MTSELKETDFRPRPENWLEGLSIAFEAYRRDNDINNLLQAKSALEQYEKSLKTFGVHIRPEHRIKITKIKITIYEQMIAHLKASLVTDMTDDLKTEIK